MTTSAKDLLGASPADARPSLKNVSTTVLVELRNAVASGLLRAPVDRAALVGFGIRHQIEAIERSLAGHKTAACLAILDVALAERGDRRPTPELVWTGPEAPVGTARDTAVVLRSLFEGARESVILAGYSFDHARDVLAPLHASMAEHQVTARFFVDIPQIARGEVPEAHLARCFTRFLDDNWPFGEPRPPALLRQARAVPWTAVPQPPCEVRSGRRGEGVRLQRELHAARAGAKHRGGRADRGPELRELPRRPVAGPDRRAARGRARPRAVDALLWPGATRPHRRLNPKLTLPGGAAGGH